MVRSPWVWGIDCASRRAYNGFVIIVPLITGIAPLPGKPRHYSLSRAHGYVEQRSTARSDMLEGAHAAHVPLARCPLDPAWNPPHPHSDPIRTCRSGESACGDRSPCTGACARHLATGLL